MGWCPVSVIVRAVRTQRPVRSAGCVEAAVQGAEREHRPVRVVVQWRNARRTGTGVLGFVQGPVLAPAGLGRLAVGRRRATTAVARLLNVVTADPLGKIVAKVIDSTPRGNYSLSGHAAIR
ncbi:hypothetical protein GCM10010129_41130 [Streptomyces fumigatiscleroticus]|nr:hypothetical protein GCM10010129_41130 [Streptomyces fumigatiscleroticus]